MTVSSAPVRRRLVLLLPGFDPSPARRYREIYRAAAAAQARIAGYEVALEPMGGGGRWRVRWHGAQPTVSEFRVLSWGDLVHPETGQSLRQLIPALFHLVWLYLSSGALWGMMRLRRGPVIVALYPFVTLAALWALGAAALLLLLPGAWPGALRWLLALLGGGLAIGALLGPAKPARLLWRNKLPGPQLMLRYLLEDYVFWARGRGGYPPILEARIDQMAAELTAARAAASRGEWDEVLVVGHSSGTLLAASMVARSLAQDGALPWPSLLTLGQVFPMVSLLPGANSLRADLRALGAADGLDWVDVSAPGDPCCFALCHPLAVSGVLEPGAEIPERRPLILSAAFKQTLSPARLRRLRWRFLLRHGQYFWAFDRPEPYDYIRTTAGPARLGVLYGQRQPSPQRITRDVRRRRA